MRRIRRKKSMSLHKIIFIFVVVLSGISIGYSLLSETLTVSGKGNLVNVNQPNTDKIKFNCKKDSWYSDGKFYYNFSCSLTNQTEENIVGWNVKMSIPDDIKEVECWNAICSIDNSILLAKNVSYNETLIPNVETNFGFQLTTVESELNLDDVIINGETSTPTPTPTPIQTPNPTSNPTPDPTEPPIQTEEIKASIEFVSSWQNEKGRYITQYQVKVINNSSINTNTWSVKLGLPSGFNVSNAWGCNYIAYEDNALFSNQEWGGTIQAGSSITFNIQIETEEKDYTPNIIEISYT